MQIREFVSVRKRKFLMTNILDSAFEGRIPEIKPEKEKF